MTTNEANALVGALIEVSFRYERAATPEGIRAIQDEFDAKRKAVLDALLPCLGEFCDRPCCTAPPCDRPGLTPPVERRPARSKRNVVTR